MSTSATTSAVSTAATGTTRGRTTSSSLLIEGTLLALVVLLPAVFNVSGALAFEPLKASILRVAALAVGVAWVLGGPQREPSAWREPVVRAALVVLALGAVSTALSIQPAISFFGSFDRGSGWLTMLACTALLVVVAHQVQTADQRERLLSALALGAVIPCLYAFAQRAGADPITWTARGEPGSTLASPTFLGGYLVLVAPIAVYKAVAAARAGTALAYGGWLALSLVVCTTIVMTTIRAPMLALVAGIASFALLARGGGALRRREVGIAAGAIALVLVLAGATGVAGLQRFANLARAGDSSVERLTVWRDALALPLTSLPRSLVGYGPDTQQVLLERGEHLVRLTQNQQWDRAHNLLLDAWLTGGALGAAAIAGLLLTLVVTIWRRTRASNRLLCAAVIGAVVGHLVEVSFAFESVTSLTVLYVLAGVAASLGVTSPGSGTRAVNGRWRVPVVGAAIVLAPLLAAPAVADALYGGAARGDAVGAARLEELAAQVAPWVEELPRAAALDWQRAARDGTDPQAQAHAEADLLNAAQRAPGEPLPQLRLLRFYLAAGELDRAEASCQAAVDAGPFRAAVWDACADVAAQQGRSDVTPLRRARAEELRQPL